MRNDMFLPPSIFLVFMDDSLKHLVPLEPVPRETPARIFVHQFYPPRPEHRPAQWRGSLQTAFLIDDNGREAVKCAQTDSNQAEDVCPAIGSSPLPNPRITNQPSGEKGRKNYESVQSIQKHNNSTSSHRADARLLWAFAASASRLPRRLRIGPKHRPR